MREHRALETDTIPQVRPRLWGRGLDSGVRPVPWGWVLALGLVLSLLTACGAAPTPTPSPTPTAPTFLTIAHPPDLTPWDADLSRCARALGVPVVVNEVARRALAQAQADLYLTWGDPPAEAQAYALGQETVWAVGRPQPSAPLSEAQLRAVFLGQVSDWADLGGPAQPLGVWVPDEDDLAYPALRDLLWGAPPTTQAGVAPAPAAMLEAVANDPGGVGLLPQRWLHPADLPPQAAAWAEQVHPLSAQALAQVPIVAYAWGTPAPAAQRLIACLQQRERR